MMLQVNHLEDVIEQTGYVLDEDSPYCLRQAELVQVITVSGDALYGKMRILS